MSKMYKQLSENDECYTPKYAVDPIVKYVHKKWLKEDYNFSPNETPTVWCPFDTNNSEFVLAFKEAGFKVINTHLSTGQDFFTYEPTEHYDYIVSNPPFRGKRLFVERAIELGKPFALLLPTTWLNDRAPFDLKVPLDILMFDKRINYGKPGISFKTNYYSWGILEDNNYNGSDITKPPVYIVEKLKVNNVKSRMWEDFETIAKSFHSNIENSHMVENKTIGQVKESVKEIEDDSMDFFNSIVCDK